MKFLLLTFMSLLVISCSGSKDNASVFNRKGWFTDNKMFFADSAANVIREVDLSTGVINTFAGSGTAGTSADGVSAAGMSMDLVTDLIAIDDDTVIFVNNDSDCIQMIDKGVVTKIAGICGTSGYAGDGGLAVDARLFYPLGICLDSKNDLYIASQAAMRKVDSETGIISTVIGNGISGAYQPSHEGQQATSVQVTSLAGCKFDRDNNLYVSGINDNVIYKMTSEGILTTIAQSASPALNNPAGLDIDLEENILYFADGFNNCFRTIDLETNTVSTYLGECGGSNPLNNDDGTLRSAAIIGAADSIQVREGQVYFSTYNVNYKIRVIEDDILGTFVGDGTLGTSGDGGQATDAQIEYPNSILFSWD